MDNETPFWPPWPVTRPRRRFVEKTTVMNVSVLFEPTLVLNRNWLPIRVCTVRRALSLVFRDMARIIRPENFLPYDFGSWADLHVPQGEPFVQAVRLRIRIPEVIVLRFCEQFTRPRVVFSRRNLFRRDKNTCQYCGRKYSTEDLSIDHVVPRSLGGKSSWTNCVVACLSCNSRKGNRTLQRAQMQLTRLPKEPPPQAALTLQLGRRKASWDHFVSEAYWNVALEE
jgi:5-methylcytosine-specific restriction endonuclease McrA